MMVHDLIQYRDLVLKLARPNIDPGWVLAIIEQESSNNPYAVRFEPKYSYFKTPDIYAKINRISLDTEIMCQKTSWGLGQLMGSTARELGFQTLLTELLDPTLNIKYMYLLIDSILRDLKEPCFEDLCAVYNGGKGALSKVNHLYPNQNYVNSCKLILEKIRSLL